jgi:hypothetical protein
MIRMLIAISGRTDGHDLESVGTVAELNPVIEEQLVAQGYAEYVAQPKPAPPPPVETAELAPAPETTAKRVTKPPPRTRKPK